MTDNCVFCDYAGPNTILWETGSVYVVEPLVQITPGHVLVIPRVHAEDFADDPAVTAEVFRGAAEYAQANGIEDANLITSRGKAASQTVFHVHVHVLPREWHDSVILPWANPNPYPVSDIANVLKAPSARLRERAQQLDDELWENEGFDLSATERRDAECELRAIEGELIKRRINQIRFRARLKASS